MWCDPARWITWFINVIIDNGTNNDLKFRVLGSVFGQQILSLLFFFAYMNDGYVNYSFIYYLFDVDCWLLLIIIFKMISYSYYVWLIL